MKRGFRVNFWVYRWNKNGQRDVTIFYPTVLTKFGARSPSLVLEDFNKALRLIQYKVNHQKKQYITINRAVFKRRSKGITRL